MENVQITSQIPPQGSGEPDLPPGTYEYVEKKFHWKRIGEIAGIIVIVVISVAASLYKINYPIVRVYQAISPSDINLPTSTYYLGGFVTAAKKIIQPVLHTRPTPTPPNVPSNTSHEAPLPTDTSEPLPFQQDTYPTINPDTGNDSNNTQDQFDSSTTTIPTDTPFPTDTPVLQQEQQIQQNPVAACYGLKNNDNCTYVSNGYTVQGRCRFTYGHNLMCVSD